MPSTCEAVLERKTRPIYDALNRGDNKVSIARAGQFPLRLAAYQNPPTMQGAIKLCNQALTKLPKQPLVTVLKAFALDRSSSVPEALALLDGIIQTGTADEDVLHHASGLLKARGQYARLLQLYTAALAQHPDDLGLLQEVFLAHVRLGGLVAQQQAAMKLNKLAPCEMHTFWVVCSMLSQAARKRGGDTAVALPVESLLKMAGGLAAKQLEREGGLSYDGVMVYLDVLQAQGRHEECARLVAGPCAAAINLPTELLRLQVRGPCA